jgi:hypothetical protein
MEPQRGSPREVIVFNSLPKIGEIVKINQGLNYLKVEVPNYWSDRKRALEVLRYLS